MKIPVVRLPHAAGLPLPSARSAGAAGLDLCAAVGEEGVEIPPGGRVLIPTGLVLAIPEGWEGEVRPRSGLALHHGVTVLNAPGTVDPDYRGEVQVLLVNLGSVPFRVNRGMRVAQLLFRPVAAVTLVEVGEVEALGPSARGAGGFGSTGLGEAGQAV